MTGPLDSGDAARNTLMGLLDEAWALQPDPLLEPTSTRWAEPEAGG